MRNSITLPKIYLAEQNETNSIGDTCISAEYKKPHIGSNRKKWENTFQVQPKDMNPTLTKDWATIQDSKPSLLTIHKEKKLDYQKKLTDFRITHFPHINWEEWKDLSSSEQKGGSSKALQFDTIATEHCFWNELVPSELTKLRKGVYDKPTNKKDKKCWEETFEKRPDKLTDAQSKLWEAIQKCKSQESSVDFDRRLVEFRLRCYMAIDWSNWKNLSSQERSGWSNHQNKPTE